tara:strand:+ start:14 stop:472 length:459 start_codon:yes stop_codon:yes gene_type:complete
MRKYNNLLLLVFIFLVNCNYKPILSSTETGFSIDKIEFLNTNKINSKLEKQLSIYQKNKNKTKFYDLVIDMNKNKTVSLRDTAGNPKIFIITISASIDVLENNNIIVNKIFEENFSYNNNKNKFDLNRYEKTIENNIINKLSERIISYLHSV